MILSYSISARGLRKRYGGKPALDGFDLEVEAGSIHGLLGPNGAGKSTAVRTLATLVSVEEGEATVAGHDVRTRAKQVRKNIGLVGQAAAVDEILTGRQNLVMFGRLFDLPKPKARRRADEVLEMFGLTEAADRPLSTYSGGMRRRLDIGASLILTPSVLFLDEPSTGLDPRARNEVWDAVRQVAALGTTVLLTTQYLDEADQLASKISVMRDGRVIADDTPDALKRQLGGDRIVVTVARLDDLDATSAALSRAVTAAASIEPHVRAVTVEAPSGASGLVSIVRELDAAGLEPDDIVLRRPSLDEVFLTLTAKENA